MQSPVIDNKNKLYLMICELHNPYIHGKTDDSDPNIENHYLVYNRYDPKTGISFSYLDEYQELDTDDEYDSEDEMDDVGLCKIQDEINFLREMYSNPSNLNYQNYNNHPTIRNYYNIVTKPSYIKLEIGEYIILPTHEAIAILKTFWIRIIQKKWKKVYNERKNIIKKRCNLYNLSIREKYGRWPKTCNYLPGLRGMLSDLKTKI